jgi:hypothetical protein
MEEIELFKKENCIFKRIDKNKYTINFNIKNDKIYVSDIIDFSIIKLIFDLNPDIYEKFIFKKINNNEGIAIFLIKHFFEDMGFTQRYSHMHITKIFEENRIIFKSKSIKIEKPDEISENVEILNIKNFTCICDLITNNHVNFFINIDFDFDLVIPLFLEKMIGLLIYKVFLRLKQFIEKLYI